MRHETLRFGQGWARLAPGVGQSDRPPGHRPRRHRAVDHRPTCVEHARASGYDSVLTGAVDPTRPRPSSTPGSRCTSACTCSRSTSIVTPAPPPSPLEQGRAPRPHGDRRSRRPRVRAVLAPRRGRSAGRGSTPHPGAALPRRPRRPPRVGVRDHGAAGQYGYLQRVAVHPDARRRGWGTRARRRRAPVALGARGRAGVREHAAREPRRARPVRGVRVHAHARRAARARRRVVSPIACRRRSGPCVVVLGRARRSPATARPDPRRRRATARSTSCSSRRTRGSRPVASSHASAPRHHVRPGSTAGSCAHPPRPGHQTRTAFDDSVDGRPAADARPCDLAVRQLAVDPANRAAAARCPRPTAPGDGGVYPLEVQLRDASDTSVAEFVTHVVVAPRSAPTAPRRCRRSRSTWRGSGRSRPTRPSSPTARPHPRRSTSCAHRPARAPGRPLAATDLPLTLAPSPETLDGWRTIARQRTDLAAGVAALRRASTRNEILAGPFVPLDLPSLAAAAGARRYADSEFTRGTTTLDRVLGTRLDPRTALPGPLDQHRAQTLLRSGRRPPRRRRRRARRRRRDLHSRASVHRAGDTGRRQTAMTVVVADAGIQRFLTGDEPPALRAAHVLAALAFVEREQPGLTRGVAIVNPSRWDATAMLDRCARRTAQEPVRARHHRRRPDRRVPVATVDAARRRPVVPPAATTTAAPGHREGVRPAPDDRAAVASPLSAHRRPACGAVASAHCSRRSRRRGRHPAAGGRRAQLLAAIGTSATTSSRASASRRARP